MNKQSQNARGRVAPLAITATRMAFSDVFMQCMSYAKSIGVLFIPIVGPIGGIDWQWQWQQH